MHTRSWKDVCAHITIDNGRSPCENFWDILTILTHITLYIMFIVIYIKGDDLLDYYRVPVICIITSYTVGPLVLILIIITLLAELGALGVIACIFFILNILFSLGIAIWSIVLLDENKDSSKTFLRIVMIIYVSLKIEGSVEELVKNLIKHFLNKDG